ncbi:hypothetical protein AQUCO_01700788v1 [Aquilegia coerulea]|uniref:Methyltransferase type 11 domain-containing protein n=1 Tax=Aquilegia coerulea TaxID=218851 RepID=A0A2G5DQG7_AQUCA|nr:hypothetical protein AQUCO_01700788v1 [Aquilegia coerulea]
MADLFIKQAKEYQQTRPSYTPELLQFITSKTPNHDLVWDVGCGSGQAAILLAGVYKNVVGTDTSEQQLSYASKLPNIRYVQTPPNMPLSDLEHKVAAQETVDLVTVAQALHWFDLPTFYEQVKWVLKKPNGILAVWCYISPTVNEAVDTVFLKLYKASGPYWDQARKVVDDRYRNIDFPFEPVDGMDHTGPFEFVTERTMDLDDYLTYIRSWSAYQTAKTKGIELLSEDVIQNFERAWALEDGNQKVVRYPVFLRIGKVGN